MEKKLNKTETYILEIREEIRQLEADLLDMRVDATRKKREIEKLDVPSWVVDIVKSSLDEGVSQTEIWTDCAIDSLRWSMRSHENRLFAARNRKKAA